MKKPSLARVRLLGVLATIAALAIAGAKVSRAGDPAPVKVTAALGAPAVQAGETAEVRFHLDVPAGQHVYPPGSQDGLPLEAKLEPALPGIAPGELKALAEPRIEDVKGVGKVAVLEGSFDLVWRLAVAGDAAPGKRELKVTFSHQACDAKVCFQPVDTSFTLALEVQPRVSIGPPLDLPPPRAAHAGFAVVPERARPGDLVRLEATLFIQPGHHVYTPDSKAGQPTTFEVTPPAGYALEGTLEAPPPTREEDDKDLGRAKLWEGKVKLARSLRVPRDATGEVKIPVAASWLVCDARSCTPGDDKGQVALAIAADAPVPSAAPTPASIRSSTGEPAAPKAEVSFWGLVGISVVSGIAMLFMPCTYPMIPVTISIFSKGKKLPRAQTWFRAAAYGGGIVISFTLVGGVVQAILGARGQNFVMTIAQNPYLNLGLGALFVYFALSFFGYYDVALPQFINNFVNKGLKQARGKPTEGGGVPTFALFLMGFFFVLTTYTCGAPIVLAVLSASAATAGKATVIIGTAIFGGTIALPFFVLALVPGAIQGLPKGGEWFHTFKVVLGVVELAASLKFFSNAELQWTLGILTRPVFLAVWFAAALFVALYVGGVLKFAHDEGPHPSAEGEMPPKIRAADLAKGVPFLAFAAFLATGFNGPFPSPASSPLHGLVTGIESFLPPDPYPYPMTPGKDGVTPAHKGFHLPTYASFDQALAAAKKTGKPLFLEFTGHT